MAEAPKDKYHALYLIFLLHGIGYLLPWNMFINAFEYFVGYKFAPENISEPFKPADYFMQCVTFVAQTPNVAFSWINCFVKIKGGLERRIIWSIILMLISFILVIIMAMLNSRNWTPLFFYLTMVLVFVINVGVAVYQNSMFGVGAKLPFEYTGALILGNNCCGTFTSSVDLLSKVGIQNLRLSAIYYFLVAVFTLLLCWDFTYGMKINRFYSIYDQYQARLEKNAQAEANKTEEDHISYKEVIKEAWPQLINAFLTLFVTLWIFPAVTASISPVGKTFLGRFFVGVTCFFTFNVTAMIGSFIATQVQWPKPKYLFICHLVKVALLPLSLMCNYHAPNTKRKTPVLFKSNVAHWLLNVINGLSCGYFTSVTMMYSARTVQPKYAQTAGMLAGACLVTGIFMGICFTFLWPCIV